jgi:molybdate transport system ATP-binding protein
MTTPEALDAALALSRGRLALEVRLTVEPGEVVALIGPNGAGKTTVLELLAGLLALDIGHVRLGARVWDDPERGVFARPEQRRVGMVFQDYLLFPHLTVLENVAFGLRARGLPARGARERAAVWLDRVGLADRATVLPGRLSGGQAQRVALVRALATEPELLLLDEPLAALDAQTRAGVRSELRRQLDAYPGRTVLVTHDAVDAMVLADYLVVLEAGSIVQSGRPADVARSPRNEYVARLVGLNLYRGAANGTAVAVDGGGSVTVAEPVGGAVFVAFAPSAVALHRHRPEGSARNVWVGTVAGVEEHAGLARVTVEGQPPVLADVTPAAVAELGLQPGQQVWVSVKAVEVRAYPA